MISTTILPSWHWYVALPAILFTLLLGILISDLITWRRMPPGPIPLPFIGNQRNIPQSQPWLQLQKWSKTYGPIFTIWIGRRPTIVISDPCIAVELLEKRSNKYSSRPRSVVMGEIYWDMSSILVQPYGKEWQTRRKALHHALTPSALRLYRPIQEAEASRLCFQLMQSPTEWEKAIDRFTSSVVFSVAYGHRIDSLNSKVLLDRFEFMQYTATLNIPGRYLAESLPFLKHIPNFLAPWKRVIQERGKVEASSNMALVEAVKHEIAESKAAGTEIPDSLTKLLLSIRETEGIPLSDRDFSFIPASLFGAGSDTTASTLCTAILAFVTHPETLKKAQEELDDVIGSSRSPTFADESQLPYLRAVVKEVLRWRPVAVLGGTPHASTADDIYEGWLIPAGTTVLCNSWAINLNEDYYTDPHHFNPARFLSKEEASGISDEKQAEVLKGRAHPSKTGHSSFGWGRRICPGEGLALNSLFVALGKLIWSFDVLPLEGVEYDIFAYTDGFNVRPQKFECTIKPRSAGHAQVVRDEMETAMKVMEQFSPFVE